MKVLVTGATGFVGSHVVNSLLKKEGIHIITSSSDDEKARAKSWYKKVQHIPFDFNAPFPQDLYAHFLEPDVLIHLAWGDLPNYSKLFHFEKNLMPQYFFVKNLVAGGLKNVNITGTCFEYGKREGLCSPDMMTKPNTPYALAKDTLRKFLQELAKTNPFNLNWIRLFYMHGEGQSKKSILSQLKSTLEKGEPTFNMSGGEQLRDYLPVDKVGDIIAGVSLQKENLGIVNCCSGKPISIRGLVEEYLTTHNQTIDLNLGFYPYTPHEPMAFWGEANY